MRARIHAHFADLHHERERIDAELKTLASEVGRDNDTGLIGELPELSTRLDELPARIHAELLAALDIQVLWNAPLKQATFFATITDTTPGIITELLTRAAGDDPAATATAAPGTTPAGMPTTSSDTFSGLSRHPIRGKSPRIPSGSSAQLDRSSP